MFLNDGSVAVFTFVAQYNFIVVCWKHNLRKKIVCSLVFYWPFLVKMSLNLSSSLHFQYINCYFLTMQYWQLWQTLNMTHTKLIIRLNWTADTQNLWRNSLLLVGSEPKHYRLWSSKWVFRWKRRLIFYLSLTVQKVFISKHFLIFQVMISTVEALSWKDNDIKLHKGTM